MTLKAERVERARAAGRAAGAYLTKEQKAERARQAALARWAVRKSDADIIRAMLKQAQLAPQVLFHDLTLVFADADSDQAQQWLIDEPECVVGTYMSGATFSMVIHDLQFDPEIPVRSRSACSGVIAGKKHIRGYRWPDGVVKENRSETYADDCY